MIGTLGNKIVRSPLMKCVEETRSIPNLIQQKKFEIVQKMRGPEFVDCLRIYKEIYSKQTGLC
jgi:hypothetical protein